MKGEHGMSHAGQPPTKRCEHTVCTRERSARSSPGCSPLHGCSDHGDLHRRNLGFTHFHKDGKRHIRLAPMYDVSSAIGTYLVQTLAIGIARQRRFSEIGVRQWLAHARECGLNPERTLLIVQNTVSHAPDAIATARATVRNRDENRHQDSVERRAEELIQYAERRKRVFTEEDSRRASRRTSQQGEAAQTPADGERCADEGHGAK